MSGKDYCGWADIDSAGRKDSEGWHGQAEQDRWRFDLPGDAKPLYALGRLMRSKPPGKIKMPIFI